MSGGHTPGPWAVSKRHDRRVTANGVMICTALLQSGPGESNTKGEEEAIANARLIAAAPATARDLLSAWAVLSIILENGWVPEQHRAPVEQCRDNAAAAIAKATGAA